MLLHIAAFNFREFQAVCLLIVLLFGESFRLSPNNINDLQICQASFLYRIKSQDSHRRKDFGRAKELSFVRRRIDRNTVSISMYHDKYSAFPKTIRLSTALNDQLDEPSQMIELDVLDSIDFPSNNDQDLGKVSDDEIDELMSSVFTEKHAQELNKKVESAMEEDYDIQQGVNPNRLRPIPLKANIDLWSYQAKQEFLKGNYTGATKLYTSCIHYNPCDGRPWLGLARVHWKKRELELAEQAYKDGLYYNPKNPFLMQAYAVQLEKTGRAHEGMKILLSSVKANPGHAASWVALAQQHLRLGDVVQCRTCYEAAVRGDPDSYVALQAWGVLEASANIPGTGNITLARELFTRALQLAPRSLHTLQAWAGLETRVGDLTGAQRLLSRALRVRPDCTRTRLTCAEVYELRGDLAGARLIFQDGASSAEAFGDAGFLQAWGIFEEKYYFVLTRQSQAVSAGNGSTSTVRSWRQPWKQMGHAGQTSAYTQEEQVQYAERVRGIFRRGLACNKYHSASWIAWAKFEERLGNLEIARKLLVSGISQFPASKNVAWFHASLANVVRKQGDHHTARACYHRALEASPPHLSLTVLLEFARFEEATEFARFEEATGVGAGAAAAARQLYELALTRFPRNTRVWDAYVNFEKRKSAPRGTRTVRTVRVPEELGADAGAGDVMAEDGFGFAGLDAYTSYNGTGEPSGPGKSGSRIQVQAPVPGNGEGKGESTVGEMSPELRLLMQRRSKRFSENLNNNNIITQHA